VGKEANRCMFWGKAVKDRWKIGHREGMERLLQVADSDRMDINILLIRVIAI
jgi:hypothetical protein